MLVDKQHRERLALFCLVTRQTQAEAANQAIAEMLERLDGDAEMKQRMDRAKELQEMLANL